MSEDWKVYENLEDFKEFFCDWIDSIVEEGYKDDSRILAMKRDGSIFFNFRDIILRHPDNDTIQDLFIEIENIEPPEWKIYINLNYRYWLKRIGTTMRKNSHLRLRRCLPRTIISRKSNSFSSKNPNRIPPKYLRLQK